MWGIDFKKYKQFLTMNERNKVFLKKNTAKGRGIASSKYRTKKVLMENEVQVPKLIKRFINDNQLETFNWEALEGNFVIKPESGYGGEGILIIKKRGKWAGEWQKMDGKIVNSQDLKLHCQEILEGKYSWHSMVGKVLIEERIKIHPLFLAFTKMGTPDIRVIVYNHVPVMAMFRIPTEKSGGKANLQQGAIGLGIDLATGITTFGIEGKGEVIKQIYNRKKKKYRKVNGIKIPFWKEILEISINCQKAIPGLGFMGIDIVLDKEKGPEVLEVNALPGLSIQVCNKAGLKGRIDKIEEVEVRSIEHGITLSKYLFGESFFDKIEAKKNNEIISPLEMIKIKINKGFEPKIDKDLIVKKGRNRIIEVKAKVDTGALRSSIDEKLARQLGLLKKDKILYYRGYKSALGSGKRRPVVGLTFWLNNKKIVTIVNVANRKGLTTRFLIGRRDLDGFSIKIKEEN